MIWDDNAEQAEHALHNIIANKIRDLFKVKLYAIRSETKKKKEREKKKRERKKRERENELDFKYLLTLILTLFFLSGNQ